MAPKRRCRRSTVRIPDRRHDFPPRPGARSQDRLHGRARGAARRETVCGSRAGIGQKVARHPARSSIVLLRARPRPSSPGHSDTARRSIPGQPEAARGGRLVLLSTPSAGACRSPVQTCRGHLDRTIEADDTGAATGIPLFPRLCSLADRARGAGVACFQDSAFRPEQWYAPIYLRHAVPRAELTSRVRSLLH